jgi:hypothetical protein
MNRFARFAPWLLLGPITGPLTEGIYRNVRAGELTLAALYAVALGFAWFDMSVYGLRLINAVAHGGS